MIVFANFLLDKATFLDRGNETDTDDDDDEDLDEGGTKKEGSTYPPFEEYLAARPEIKRILSRRTLD